MFTIIYTLCITICTTLNLPNVPNVFLTYGGVQTSDTISEYSTLHSFFFFYLLQIFSLNEFFEIS